MILNKSFKVELDPNNTQITHFKKSCGVARFAWNWGLNLAIEQYEKDKIYFSAFPTIKQLNSIKKEQFPWMYEVSKFCSGLPLKNLEQAFKRFGKKISKLPKFKKKNNEESYTVGLDAGGLKITNSFIKLPRIGKIKLKEKNYLPIGIPKQATISCKAGRWFVSVLYEIEQEQLEFNDEVIGVDLGIKSFMTTSEGEQIKSSKELFKQEKKLKKLQRKLSRQTKDSNSYNKTKKKLQIVHFRIVNIRKDFLHKITSMLVKTKPHGVIVIEDLNVKGMMKNHHLSKSLGNIGLFTFRRQIEYKSKWYGKQVIIADRWFPSSKLCSQCGFKKDKLKLSERIYHCENCGLEIDRDLNAAMNLKQYGANILEQNRNGSSQINADGDEKFIDEAKADSRCSSKKSEFNSQMFDISLKDQVIGAIMATRAS